MVSPILVSEEVARVCEDPDCNCPAGPMEDRPPVTQFPFTLRHPAAKSMPLLNVEVAEVPVTFR